jgi:hypothetical protein
MLQQRWIIKKDTKLKPPFVIVVCRKFDIEKRCMYSTIIKEIDFKRSYEWFLMWVWPELAIETICIHTDGSVEHVDYKHTLDMTIMDIRINEKMQNTEDTPRTWQIWSHYVQNVLS